MKLISIVVPCLNEDENVDVLHARIQAVFGKLCDYDYELIFIDNASSDATVERIKNIVARDPRVGLIVNARNFGHIRSPMHAFTQIHGDACVIMVADLQDPPELLPEFIAKWEAGFRIVVGVKPQSRESPLMFGIRRAYYRLIGCLSEIQQIQNFTGYGLYDRAVVDYLRQIDDPYPYFRGIIADIGFDYAVIPYVQPRRERGVTKNNFYTLYDLAMLGITSYSKVPLRLATMSGFALSLLSLLVAFGYFVAKLVMWDSFSLGVAPMVIGMFLFGSVQLFFIGILGEYIGAIHTQVLKRPLVVEKERVNFPSHSLREQSTGLCGEGQFSDPTSSSSQTQKTERITLSDA